MKQIHLFKKCFVIFLKGATFSNFIEIRLSNYKPLPIRIRFPLFLRIFFQLGSNLMKQWHLNAHFCTLSTFNQSILKSKALGSITYMFVSKGSIHQTYEFISKWHIFKTLVVFAMKYKHIKTSCTCNFNLLLSLKYKQMFIILTT